MKKDPRVYLAIFDPGNSDDFVNGFKQVIHASLGRIESLLPE
jgi:hypothetical protein